MDGKTEIDALGILNKFAADLAPRLQVAVVTAYAAVNASFTTIPACFKHGERHSYKPIIFRHHSREVFVRDLSEVGGLDLDAIAAGLALSISGTHVAFSENVLLTFAAPEPPKPDDESMLAVLATNQHVSVRAICRFDMNRGTHVITATAVVTLENRCGEVKVIQPWMGSWNWSLEYADHYST